MFANICNYPHCSSKLRTRVNQLFRKAREIEGGSEMLAKRLGIYSLYR